MLLFANDTTLMCVTPTEQLLMSTLNAAMTKICTWLKINYLDLNIGKSNFFFLDLRIFILGSLNCCQSEELSNVHGSPSTSELTLMKPNHLRTM